MKKFLFMGPCSRTVAALCMEVDQTQRGHSTSVLRSSQSK